MFLLLAGNKGLKVIGHVPVVEVPQDGCHPAGGSHHHGNVLRFLEDSYNGVRAGARGGFVTVMVPDLAPADDEMRRLYTAECKDLREVKKMLEEGKLLSEA